MFVSTRRALLTGAIALMASPLRPRAGAQPGPRLLAPVTRDGHHFLAIADRPEAPPRLIPMPMRGHALLLDPRHPDQVVMMARRPGTLAVRVDIAQGKLLNQWEAEEGRHFFGHACLSPDGCQVFVAENNTETGQGVISMRDAPVFRC